jgi:hypothetical protein
MIYFKRLQAFYDICTQNKCTMNICNVPNVDVTFYANVEYNFFIQQLKDINVKHIKTHAKLHKSQLERFKTRAKRHKYRLEHIKQKLFYTEAKNLITPAQFQRFKKIALKLSKNTLPFLKYVNNLFSQFCKTRTLAFLLDIHSELNKMKCSACQYFHKTELGMAFPFHYSSHMLYLSILYCLYNRDRQTFTHIKCRQPKSHLTQSYTRMNRHYKQTLKKKHKILTALERTTHPCNLNTYKHT